MKYLLKATGLFLLDQFVGAISGSMLVLCVASFFQNSLTGYVLAFCICFGFYVYATYNSAFKYGFHDSHRAIKDLKYKGYLYKGAIAGAFSTLPLFILYIFYRLTGAGILGVYYMVANMYWTWPLKGIFPNHVQTVMITAFLPIIIIPWLGYIAGYKNFYFADLAMKLYRKFTPENIEK